MPGVHSDVGGSSDGRFLGNVALLTMVDRIKRYCPELEWDESYLQRILKALRDRPIPEITDERRGILSKFLWRRHRSMGGNENEFIHSVFNSLADKEFKIRGVRRRYEPTNYNRKVPELNIPFDEEIRDICGLD
jgi:hypothetical protein